MKKNTILLLCFSFLIAFVLSYSIKTSDIQIISTSFVGDDEYFYYLEDDYDLYKLTMDGTIITHKKLPRRHKENLISYKNITVDEDGNMYLIVTEENQNKELLKQWIQVFNPKGKKQKTFLEIDYPMEQEEIFTEQFVNGNLYVFTVNRYANTLTLHRYDSLTDKTIKKEFQFEQLPQFDWIKYTDTDSIYYTTKEGDFYCLYNASTKKYNQKISFQENGIEKSIPGNLSSDGKGNVYYYDICTPSFVKYSEKVDKMARLYTGNDPITPDYTFEDLCNFKMLGENMIAFSNLLKNHENFVVVIDEDGMHKISERKLQNVWFVLIILGITFVCFGVFWLLSRILSMALQTKSILWKQILVVVPLLLFGTLLITKVIYDRYLKMAIYETDLQLYSLSVNISNNINPEELKALNVPVPLDDPIHQQLKNSADISVEKFYSFMPDAVKKSFYYEIYLCKDKDTYLIYDADESRTVHYGGIHEYYTESNRVKREEFHKESSDGNVAFFMDEQEGGKWIYCRNHILDDQGVRVGKVEVGIDFTKFKEEVNHLFYRFLLYLISLMAVILFVILFMMKKTLFGLKKLKQGVVEISNGNWDTMVDIESKDELEEIGNAFNKMTGKIKSYFQNIEALSVAYEKFVPSEMFEILHKDHILDVKLGDYVIKKMNVMSITTRNFYGMSEMMTKEENFYFVNTIYGTLAKVIRREGGFIEDYHGGGLKAIFDRETDFCLDCMLEILEKFRSDKNYPIQLNTVIQSGDIMFGIVGSKQRLNATAVSDVLNYTPILETLAYNNDIALLITDSSYQQIQNKGKYTCRYIGKIKDRKTHGHLIDLYDVVDAYPFEARQNKKLTLELFEKGVEHYVKGDLKTARKYFIDIIQLDKEDKLAQTYLFLCDKYMHNLPRTWAGYFDC